MENHRVSRMKEHTPGEASKILQIPPSSLRRYVVLFSAWLSESANKKRGRTFTNHDLDVLYKIRELAHQGTPLDNIGSELGEVIEVDRQEDKLSEETALAIVQRLYTNLADVVQEQQDQAAQLADLHAKIDQLAQDLQEERSKTLIQRLFNRPQK